MSSKPLTPKQMQDWTKETWQRCQDEAWATDRGPVAWLPPDPPPECKSEAEEHQMKPVAWYDPSNGVVSTDRDSPLFTPLGQVWPLYPQSEQPKVRTGNCLRVGVCASEGHKIAPQRTWVGLTDEEVLDMARTFGAQPWPPNSCAALGKMIEAKLKEKNT